MNNPEPRTEILELPGSEDLGPIRCEGDWDTEGGDVLSEDVDEAGGGVGAEPVDGDPVGEPADKDQVGFSPELEEVRTD